jgi:AmmeMemoRadiSam system protein B
MMDIRPSPISGRWYPGRSAALAESVDEFLNAAQVSPHPQKIVGVIAPHAGHIYSGAVAGYAFQSVRGLEVDTIAIASPSHFHDDGALITSGHESYETPLGIVAVDQSSVEELRNELANSLHKDKSESLVPIQCDQEHAIEIELPFLQRVFGNTFSLIPIMMRNQTERISQALGNALAKVLRGKRALIVGSSDLSHFYPDKIAKQLDAVMLKQIDNFDPRGVLKTEEEGRGFACGHGAIAATLWAARDLGATHAKVIKHATSGDVSGDRSSVVGYGAAVIWKE